MERSKNLVSISEAERFNLRKKECGMKSPAGMIDKMDDKRDVTGNGTGLFD